MAQCAQAALTLYTVGVLMAVFSMSKSTSVLRVHEGQSVRMNCSAIRRENYGYSSSVTWLRQTDQSAPVSILTTKYDFEKSEMGTLYFNGFNNKQIEASMNTSVSSIVITSVSVSDSGLYYCGTQPDSHMVYYNTTYLNVTGDGTSDSSGSKSTSEVVRGGQMVQLNCSAIGRYDSRTISVTWLKQNGQSSPVSILISSYEFRKSDWVAIQYHNDYNSSHISASMTSSMSTLVITSVRVSDSGLYYCGVTQSDHMVYYNATYLNVTGLPDEAEPVPSERAGDGVCVSVVLVLAVLSVLLNLVLLLIIILLKHRSRQTHVTVPGDQISSPPEQARESDSLNYAALNFKKKKQRRTNLQTDDVVYAATR